MSTAPLTPGTTMVVIGAAELDAAIERAVARGRAAGWAEAQGAQPVALPLTQAAQRLGMSRDMLAKLCNTGAVTSRHVGKTRLVDIESGERYVRGSGR